MEKISWPPFCPDCGKPLTYDVSTDDYYSGDGLSYTCTSSGYCESCDKDYQWKDVFSLTRIDDFHQIQPK